MACCKADRFGNWCKDASLVYYKDGEGGEYCVFHAPAKQKGMSVDDFNKLVREKIDKSNKDESPCDFRGTIFPGMVSFKGITFRQKVSFSRATFTQDADFFRAKFTQDVNFSEARFKQNANFLMARFTQDANFIGAKFTQDANFIVAKFMQDANFIRAKFTQYTSFSEAKFTQYAYFRGARFTQEVNFWGARFTQVADFSGAMFKKGEFYGESFYGTVRFEAVQIEDGLRFHNVSLKKAAFRHVDLSNCHFITCKWNGKGGRYRLHDETRLYIEWMTVLNYEQGFQSRVEEIEDLYRQMKQKAQDEHNMYAYSYWHYSEKEMMCLRTRFWARPFKLTPYFPDWFASPFKWITLRLYRLFSGFGEEPLKAFIGLLALVGLSGVMIANNGEPVEGWPNAVATLKHLTFMKGAVVIDKTWFGFLTVFVTRIIVPLQAALFGFALRNRFRR